MKKTLLPLALLVVALFGIYACLNTSSGGGGAASRVAYKHPVLVLTMGVQMEPDTLAATIDADLGYQVSGLLPDGLEIDFKTGTISGTPTEVSSAMDYKVIALSSKVAPDSTIVNITVRDPSDTTNLSGPPVIISQPYDVTVSSGGTATFSVTASGKDPLSYQWMKGSSNLAGKTSASLTLTNVSAADTGSYKCKVTNSLGSVTSTTAHLSLAGGNSNGLLEFDLGVLNSPGGASGTMITREIDYYCDSLDRSLADTTLDTSYYAVTGGKLYTWDDPKACYATQMSGTSSTVIGTWTAIDGLEVLIPATYRPSGCTGIQDTTYNDFGGLFQNVTVTYTVSATKIHAKISGDVCFAEEFSSFFADSGSGITVSNASCSFVNLTNTSNHTTASITSSFANNTLGLQFKSGSSTCTMSELIPLPGVVQSCSQAQDTTFFTCLESSPFYGTGLAKKSAGAATLVQHQLHKAFPLWRKDF